jgi:hypothetical protein
MLLHQKRSMHKRKQNEDDENMYVEEFPHRISKMRLDSHTPDNSTVANVLNHMNSSIQFSKTLNELTILKHNYDISETEVSTLVSENMELINGQVDLKQRVERAEQMYDIILIRSNELYTTHQTVIKSCRAMKEENTSLAGIINRLRARICSLEEENRELNRTLCLNSPACRHKFF